MSNWYFYDKNGNKVGPIKSVAIKALSRQGLITPGTIIENEAGKSAMAGKVKGLEFPNPSATASPVEQHPESAPKKLLIQGVLEGILQKKMLDTPDAVIENDVEKSTKTKNAEELESPINSIETSTVLPREENSTISHFLSTPQELYNTIDILGNTLAAFCSDVNVLQYIDEIFHDTFVGIVFDSIPKLSDESVSASYSPVEAAKHLERITPYVVEKASIFFKVLLISDCLKQIQFAIYADETVEEGELDAAFQILEPLVKFCYMFGPCRDYRSWMNRGSVFEFMRVHMFD